MVVCVNYSETANCCFVMSGNNIKIYPLLIPQPVLAEGSVNEFEMHTQNKKPTLERSAN